LHYVLQLANGFLFHFIGIDKAKSWLEKLAYIMQLVPSVPKSEFSRITIISKNMIDEADPKQNINPELRLGLPNSGWQIKNYNSLRFWSYPDTHDIIYAISDGEDHINKIIDMDKMVSLIFILMIESGGLPLHSALIEKDGFGVALVGRGGIGKSTSSRRVPSPWRPLCDDEILVVPDQQGRYMVHPFPTWSDYIFNRNENTWNVQQYVPLKAIFFLERDDDEINEVVPLGQGQSSIYINYSSNQVLGNCFYNKEDRIDKGTAEEHLRLRKKLFDNSCELAKSIPAFKLPISLTRHFWEDIEKVLDKEI